MPRKTYNVNGLRLKVNAMIAAHATNCPDDTATRKGMAAVLEFVLHDTDNYRGFSYLDGPDAVRLGAYDPTAVRYH